MTSPSHHLMPAMNMCMQHGETGPSMLQAGCPLIDVLYKTRLPFLAFQALLKGSIGWLFSLPQKGAPAGC